MLGCVDTSLKGSFYRGHVYFSDTTNKTFLKFSIGMNNWTRTIFIAESRTLYEAFKMMLRFQIDHSGGNLIMHTDNKRLKLVMNKKNLTYIDLSQDSGAIIVEMIEMWKKLRFEVEINFIKKEKELVTFDQNPIQYLI